jgi:mono/diheme cytochrome c family protein
MRSSLLGSIIATAAVIASPTISARGADQTLTADAIPRTTADYADDTDYRAVLTRYCVTCHNERLKTAGLMLDKMDLADIPAGAEVWEKVIRKVRAGMMPPPGMPRPEDRQRQTLAAWLEQTLDDAAARRPNPGRALIHRLNRAEYANAIRDLLALNVDAGSLLPPDDAAYGFDNIADALGVSPMLLERYLSAAGRISALAVANRKIEPASETFRIRQDASQDVHVEGLPFGTVGGLAVQPTIPLDAEYRFQVKLYRTNTAVVRGLENPHQLEMTVDGERVLLAAFGGEADFKASMENPTTAGDDVEKRFDVRVPLKAGPHVVTAAFLATATPSTVRLQPFVRSSFDTLDPSGHPHIESLTVTGPFSSKGVGDTPSRRKIFVCHPANRISEAPCAQRIISTLARKAYRRPVTHVDIQPLLNFYRAARDARGFEEGIEVALQRILTDPEFVFRAERDPEDAAPGTVYRISDLELAARLSFFLWSSIPDDQLFRVASQGRLHIPSVLDQQVRRMLIDPKSEALVQNFAGQWLYLRNLKNQVPNSMAFPDFDDNLRQSFRRETELLFESIMREDRNIVDLMTADYTFVNERLARHYGIPKIYGSHFRRVPIADPARSGLLGQGSILMVTSHADRTSPPVRGKWVLDNLLGTPPPAPPANVPPLKEDGQREKGKLLTMRERMEEHRANPACAACHQIMDPIGFALENFDAVGAWRSHEGGAAGTPIDASGQLMDGTKVSGVVALREALVREPEGFVRTVTEKLLTYALGRGLGYADMPVVRGIVRASASQNYRFSSLVLGIVNSSAFRLRTAAPRDIQANESRSLKTFELARSRQE